MSGNLHPVILLKQRIIVSSSSVATSCIWVWTDQFLSDLLYLSLGMKSKLIWYLFFRPMLQRLSDIAIGSGQPYNEPIFLCLKVAGPTPVTSRAAARTAAWWPTRRPTSRMAHTTSAAVAVTCATSTSPRASLRRAQPLLSLCVSATNSTVMACFQFMTSFECHSGSTTCQE